MENRLIIALDGHDGAGKTTLAAALAEKLGGVAVRPFSGENGARLMQAGQAQDVDALVEIADSAIETAISACPDNVPLVLDRGWMTVASLVPDSEDFLNKWQLWFPTVLCWADMDATLSRLSQRIEEEAEALQWHRHYLRMYLSLAERFGCPIIRTDLASRVDCIEQLMNWVRQGPKMPRLLKMPAERQAK